MMPEQATHTTQHKHLVEHRALRKQRQHNTLSLHMQAHILWWTYLHTIQPAHYGKKLSIVYSDDTYLKKATECPSIGKSELSGIVQQNPGWYSNFRNIRWMNPLTKKKNKLLLKYLKLFFAVRTISTYKYIHTVQWYQEICNFSNSRKQV